MGESDRGREAFSSRPRGHVEETPEARPVQPPAWRDQFVGPVLQPGEQYLPEALGWHRQRQDPAQPQARPAVASATGPTAAEQPRPQPMPRRAAPIAEPEPESESELEPEAGQVYRERSVGAGRDVVETTPAQSTEQGAEQARQATEQARHLADRMRPLAADAATFAARALNLGAKGLAGLATRLDERRARDEKPGG